MILTAAQTPAGNMYYQATAKIYKTGFAGVGMTSTELYDQPFWQQVSEDIPLAIPESSNATAFLSTLDAQVEARRIAQADEDRRALDVQQRKEAEERYRASPQYAADQKRQKVESCKATIAKAHAALVRDDRIAQISGYQNTVLREQAAELIVACEDYLAHTH